MSDESDCGCGKPDKAPSAWDEDKKHIKVVAVALAFAAAAIHFIPPAVVGDFTPFTQIADQVKGLVPGNR